jgi:WD40 repeat protein
MIKVLKEAKIGGSILDFSVDENVITAVDNSYNLYIFSSNSLAMIKSLSTTDKYESLHAFSKAMSVGNNGMINLGFSKSRASLVLRREAGNNIKKVKSLAKHESDVESSCFSDDQSLLATGGSDGRVFIFDTKYMEVISTLDIQDDYISSLVFSPDGSYLIASCYNKSNIIFDVDKNVKIGMFMTTDVVENLKFFDNNKKLYIVTRDKNSIVYDLMHLKTLSTKPIFNQWPTNVILSPDEKYAIVATRETNVYVVNIEKNEKYFEVDLDIIGVTNMKIFDNVLYVTGSDGTIKIVDYSRGTLVVEKQLKTKNYQKVRDMMNENKFLMLTDIKKEFDKGWEPTLKRAIGLISKDEVEAAIKLAKPFIEEEDKAEEFNFYLSQKTQVLSFINNMQAKKYVENFILLEKYPYLKDLELAKQLELIWQKTFQTARKLLEEDTNINRPKAMELLKPYQRVKNKDSIIRNLFQNSDKFTLAEQAVREREFAKYFALIAKWEFLQDMELHKKVMAVGDNMYRSLLSQIQEKDFVKAKETVEILQQFKPYKDKVKELLKELESNMGFFSAVSAGDVAKAYRMADINMTLRSTPEFQELNEEFKKLLERAKKEAFGGQAKNVYTILDNYMDIDFTLDKVASIMKIAYLNEIKNTGGKSDFHWQKTIDNYLSMFNFDIELKRALEDINKVSYVEEMDEKEMSTPGYKSEGLQRSVLIASKNI